MFYASRKRGRSVSPWVVMMGMELLSQISQLPNKPPVTLALIAINVAAWLQVEPLSMLLGIPEPMMCPSEITNGRRPLSHLFLAAFIHAPDGGYHLIYNMSSLLWKGVTLELQMGSQAFLVMVGTLLLLSHALFVPLAYLATFMVGAPTYYTCAVGFSAVLFALKVVMNHSQVGEQAVSFWGIPLPVHAKYAAWVELILISMVTPNASFVGHLCGILAGVLWLCFGRWFDILESATRRSLLSGSSSRQSTTTFNWGSGTVGSLRTPPRPTPQSRNAWDDEAQVREAIRRSLHEY